MGTTQAHWDCQAEDGLGPLGTLWLTAAPPSDGGSPPPGSWPSALCSLTLLSLPAYSQASLPSRFHPQRETRVGATFRPPPWIGGYSRTVGSSQALGDSGRLRAGPTLTGEGLSERRHDASPSNPGNQETGSRLELAHSALVPCWPQQCLWPSCTQCGSCPVYGSSILSLQSMGMGWEPEAVVPSFPLPITGLARGACGRSGRAAQHRGQSQTVGWSPGDFWSGNKAF